MIEAIVNVPKDIVVKGTKNSRRFKEYIADTKAMLIMYFFAWSAIIFVDVVTSNTDLIWWHFFALMALALFMSAATIIQWNKEIESVATDIKYNVKLDESGVYINYDEKHIGWDQYEYFIEYEDYLMLKDKNTGISFLPKNAELDDVLEYTKTKIPNKTNKPGRF